MHSDEDMESNDERPAPTQRPHALRNFDGLHVIVADSEEAAEAAEQRAREAQGAAAEAEKYRLIS